jgi:hypothetical protein
MLSRPLLFPNLHRLECCYKKSEADKSDRWSHWYDFVTLSSLIHDNSFNILDASS